MSYNGTPIASARAVELYRQSRKAIMAEAIESGVSIELEQHEIMQVLKKIVKGSEFDEFQI